VQRVVSLTITLDGTDASPCADVPIPAGNLLNVTSVGVVVDASQAGSP